MRVDGPKQVLPAGESVTVPPGTPHTIWNAGDGEVQKLVEFRPALVTMFGLARDGKTDKRGRPSLLRFAAGASEYSMYLAGRPIHLQKALFVVLLPLARLCGYQPFYTAKH